MEKYPTIKWLMFLISVMLLCFCCGMTFGAYMERQRIAKNAVMLESCRQSIVREAILDYVDWIDAKRGKR